MPEQFVFYLHHGIQFDIKSNLIKSWEMTLNNVYPTFIDLQRKIIKKSTYYMNVNNNRCG
jgi:hypothetical protein